MGLSRILGSSAFQQSTGGCRFRVLALGLLLRWLTQVTGLSVTSLLRQAPAILVVPLRKSPPPHESACPHSDCRRDPPHCRRGHRCASRKRSCSSDGVQQ